MFGYPAHRGRIAIVAFAMILLPALTTIASADSLMTNGGFESGFAGWTLNNQLGSEGGFQIQNGTASPGGLFEVPAPPEGVSAAMSDAEGPGSHLLYQDFTAPVSPLASAILKFDLFLGNRADQFYVPTSGSLDFSTPALNQQARVDILLASADPFSTSPSDILMNVFQTNPLDPTVWDSYATFTVDLTALLLAHQGEGLRLRFAEVDNVDMFQLGVDNVSLGAVPEPSSLFLIAPGVLIALAARRRRAA